jgi:hypothetical protein
LASHIKNDFRSCWQLRLWLLGNRTGNQVPLKRKKIWRKNYSNQRLFGKNHWPCKRISINKNLINHAYSGLNHLIVQHRRPRVEHYKDSNGGDIYRYDNRDGNIHYYKNGQWETWRTKN